MKQRVEEMEREANKLRELQAAAEKAERGSVEASDTSVPMETEEDKAAADNRSIFVGNVSSPCSRSPLITRRINTFSHRSIIQRRPKKFRLTSRPVVSSTE